jgi:hypothetical protein
MEENASALKEVKAFQKKYIERNVPTVGNLNGHLAAISRLLLTTIAGLTVTK